MAIMTVEKMFLYYIPSIATAALSNILLEKETNYVCTNEKICDQKYVRNNNKIIQFWRRKQGNTKISLSNYFNIHMEFIVHAAIVVFVSVRFSVSLRSERAMQ